MATFDINAEMPLLRQEALLKSIHQWACDNHAGDTSQMDLHEVLALAERYLLETGIPESLSLWSDVPMPGAGLQSPAAASVRRFRNTQLNEPAHPVFGGNDVGIQRHWRYFPVTSHRHDFYEIVCVVTGRCGQLVGKESFTAETGDILIVPPGTPHALAAFNDECIVYNLPIKSSTFERNFLSILQSRHVLARFFAHTLYAADSEAWILFHTGDWLRGENLLALIRDETLRVPDEYRREMLNTLTKAFFLHLLSNFSDSVTVSMNESPESRIMEQIQLHLRNRFRTTTLEETARVVNYSSRQVERMLKRSLGRSFSEIVRELRMGHAASLLKETAIPVGDVAEQAGYASLSAFYRGFRELYGMSPADYRLDVTAASLKKPRIQ